MGGGGRGGRGGGRGFFFNDTATTEIYTLSLHDALPIFVFEGNRAVGIEYDCKGVRQIARADKELILSGGSINSPQLLMLSGIGPAGHLREMGIEPVVDLPGVGQNLQDHPTVQVKFACTKPVTIHKVANPIHMALAGARWLINQTGVAASNIWEAGGLVRGNADVPYPNLQYHFGPVGVDFEGTKIKLDQAYTLTIDQLRPTSRGEIKLKSVNPADKPALYFNYMSTEHDRRELVEGVRLARELLHQKAFDEFRGAEIYPGPDGNSDEEILSYIRGAIETDYHPCCTARMGNDAMAVVDEEMRVHGIEGLRVVDASVMPQIPSANLNAQVQMIAARAADFILGREQLEPFHAKFH
mgnify:FL=1